MTISFMQDTNFFQILLGSSVDGQASYIIYNIVNLEEDLIDLMKNGMIKSPGIELESKYLDGYCEKKVDLDFDNQKTNGVFGYYVIELTRGIACDPVSFRPGRLPNRKNSSDTNNTDCAPPLLPGNLVPYFVPDNSHPDNGYFAYQHKCDGYLNENFLDVPTYYSCDYEVGKFINVKNDLCICKEEIGYRLP